MLIYVNNYNGYSKGHEDVLILIFINIFTLRMMLMVLESSTLNSLVVRPSPLSLASQHLHGKMYLIPLVGTATANSSTSQQLSGVAPLCPS